jgi:processive 1,2-diacylglycerol beta-glucosyltransferase
MIWVLTAGFGDGHNTAATHVAAALRRSQPTEPVAIMDLMAMTTPRLAAFSQAAYRHLIVHQPWLWHLMFKAFASPSLGEGTRLMRPLIERLNAELRHQRPRLIVSTYPIYATLLEIARAEGQPVPPVLTVITDAISIHPTWTMHPSSAYCVLDECSREIVQRMVPAACPIHVTGFPIEAALANSEPTQQAQRRGLLYLPSTPPAHVQATLQALRPLLVAGQRLTIAPGRHARRYYHQLRRFAESNTDHTVEVLPWTDAMPALLAEHAVVITKAGGAITNEALAARTPVILDYVVPGQEEGNAQRLVASGWALRSHSPAQTAELAQRLLGPEGEAMSTRMASLNGIHAADRVAEIACQLMEV